MMMIHSEIPQPGLANSCEANGTSEYQTTNTLVERQVHREQDIAPVIIQIHRQVDEGRVGIHIIHLDPPNLGRIQPDGLSLIENKLIINP